MDAALGKKSWDRPACIKVRLVPEEAVLWGCKVLVGSVAKDGIWAGTCITGANCPSLAS